MSSSLEEIARDLVVAAIDHIAVGDSEQKPAKIAAAFKTILQGLDEASAAVAETSRKRSGF